MQGAFNVMRNERAMLGLSDVMLEIETAFASAQPEASKRLVSGVHWENEEIEREFALLPAADCPDRIVKWFKSALGSLSAPGFAMAVPYYMKASLRDVDSEITDSIILHLARASASSENYSSHYREIDDKKKSALCSYLRFIGEHYDIGHYIESDFREACENWCGPRRCE